MYIYTYFSIKVIMHSINITLLMKTDTWTDIYPLLKYEQSWQTGREKVNRKHVSQNRLYSKQSKYLSKLNNY